MVPGSSPHTRGTPGSRSCQGYRLWDHPRIRGEHSADIHHAAPATGIIPAYAGNTKFPIIGFKDKTGSSPHTRGTLGLTVVGCLIASDHPRIRGEHCSCAENSFRNVGIIPAYAGNTTHWQTCGYVVAGSSPHTRGTRCCRSRRCGSRRDHPRIRGEHDGYLPQNRLRPPDHPRIRGEHTYLPAIPIPGVAVLYHFIQSDGPCASCLHRSSLTSWLHSSSHLRNRSTSPSKPNHRNPWASSWIDEHEMQHVAHYWPNRPLSPCHR